MAEEIADKPIYIVISQTGTFLSRILKFLTGREYNHVSVSLEDDLNLMYSFGRKNPYNAFWAGFVAESANFGTFKRFCETKVIVGKICLGATEYQNLKGLIEGMIENPECYHYNYLGLYLAALRIPYTSHNRYYCSEFVKYLLIKHNVEGANQIKRIPHPMCFIDLPQFQVIYKGKLADFKNNMVLNKK